MIDNIKKISHLILKKLNGKISHSESLELDEWLSGAEENRIWFDRLRKRKSLLTRMMMAQAAEEAKIKPDWDKFTKKYFPDNAHKSGKVIFIGSRIAVAASILVLLSSGVVYWFVKSRLESGRDYQATSRNDVPAPNGDNTVLTLGDGSRIVLDSMNVGKLATQGKTNINKTSKGQIVYAPLNGTPSAEILMNTLSTSYGGLSKVVLPDGTTVWLNSLSSLRFPTIFSGKNREVDLTGEAYFEIAPNKNKPFHVRVNGTEINVLGTHFDVMAYSNEKEQKITLLEGSVKVSAGSQYSTLNPGQQARIGGTLQVVNEPDPDQTIAWVGGKFKFHAENIESIMRQLERWYNIEAVFEGRPAIELSGSISKTKNLSEVLHLLKLSGVNCSIEGRRVIVRP